MRRAGVRAVGRFFVKKAEDLTHGLQTFFLAITIPRKGANVAR
jgi:hypothetical protein